MIERLIGLKDEPPSEGVMKDMFEKLTQGLSKKFPEDRRMQKIVQKAIKKVFAQAQKAENKIN